MKDALKMVRDSYPDKIILPSIGNNDVITHNSVTCTDDEKSVYYKDVFDAWFPADNMPAGMDRDTAWASFAQGGYYRYDF